MPIKKFLQVPPKEYSLFRDAKNNNISGPEKIGDYIFKHGSPDPTSLGAEVYENYRCATQEKTHAGFQFLESRMQTLNKKAR